MRSPIVKGKAISVRVGEGIINEPEIIVYGADWCPDVWRARWFLEIQQMRYKWVDIERDPEACAYVERVNGGKRIVPTIVFGEGSILVEPSNAELAAKLGLTIEPK